MLDEEEFASIDQLFRDCTTATKEFRLRHDLPLGRLGLDERFRPVRLRYRQLTGIGHCHHTEIRRHRLALYGPPCTQCGRPLRTPRAKLCAACMTPAEPAP